MPGVFQTSFHQYNGINNYTCIYDTYRFYKTKTMFSSYSILPMSYDEYFKPEYKLLNGSIDLKHIKMAINLI
jgi:hypothetical protein